MQSMTTVMKMVENISRYSLYPKSKPKAGTRFRCRSDKEQVKKDLLKVKIMNELPWPFGGRAIGKRLLDPRKYGWLIKQ